MVAVAVALAGAVGAPTRFILDGWLQRRAGTTVPVGTLAVNLVGAFALGLLTGLVEAAAVSDEVAAVLSGGLLGGFTTFSTFTFEALRLAEEAVWRALATYLAVTLIGGLAAAALGLWCASLV